MTLRALLIIICCTLSSLNAEERIKVHVDAAQPLGGFKQLHGINKGPLAPGGLVDVTEAHKALRIPWTRLHDCHWPTPDVVDMHVVFPNPKADPTLESSYDFVRTDRYLAAVKQTGAGIIYRLGESIEHEPEKRYVHPPESAERWADACIGIIRHYNEGWAKGQQLNIPYWEIWNEPENRPAMWTGNDAQFFELYRVASRKIKARFPHLKIGGPAIGGTGEIREGKWIPSEFVKSFLTVCQRESLPLDFFSWHCYSNDPSELVVRAKAVRSLLNELGFQKTESHLNEWNYLPQNSWSGLTREAKPIERAAAYEAIAGPAGATFLASSLMQFQDAPLDVANLFHGECGGFGLFSEHGVPTISYQALLAFSNLAAQPVRLATQSSSVLCTASAGLNAGKDSMLVLLSYQGTEEGLFDCTFKNLPWPSEKGLEVTIRPIAPQFNAAEKKFLTTTESLLLPCQGPTVVMLELKPAK